MDETELRRRIEIADKQIKDAKELRLDPLVIKQAKQNKAYFEAELMKLTHWYYK